MNKQWTLADIMQEMLADNMKKKLLVYLLFYLFFNLNANAEINFFKCPEKINNLSVENNTIQKKMIEGESIVKIEKSTLNIKVDIYFMNSQDNKISELIINKIANSTSLGFDVENNINNDQFSRETLFSFIEIKDNYAFTRKEFYWKPGEYDENEIKYNYTSSGRCEKINKAKFDNFFEKTSTKSKQNTSEIKNNKTTTLDNVSINELSGERTFALSWEGYNDLILGSLIFNEANLLGTINFDLPNKDGSCFGTYALSKNKGTWSIRCDKNDMNASGLLNWNLNDGSVTGTGKDNSDRKVKFKVGPN